MQQDKITPEDVIKGLETTIQELGPRLKGQVDDMSTKQLRRALEASINYISERKDDRDASALGKPELEFLGGMFTLIETSVQYSLNIISQLQQEQIAAEKAAKGSEDKNE